MISTRLWKGILGPFARHALGDRVDNASVSALLDATLADYSGRRSTIPREPTFGARITVRLAALTSAFYDALRSRGLSEQEAVAVTAKASWMAYARMASVPRAVAKLTARGRLHRLRRATGVFRWFPFGPPGYVMQDVDAGDAVVAFDVTRCPVAEYFRTRGQSELCVHTFCALDFPLAKEWDAVLERPLTLAAGDSHCDFRWRPVGEH